MSRASVAPSADLLCWKKRFLTWAVDPKACFKTVDLPEACAAMEWALRCWEEACYLFFSPGEFASADVRIVTGEIPGRALAWSDLPDGSDMFRTVRFNTMVDWCFEGKIKPTSIDLGLCALHEFGHVIGIPHLAGNCVMSDRPHDRRVVELTDIDVAAALERYPRTNLH